MLLCHSNNIKPTDMSTYADNVNQLTRQYNDAIRALENAFDM